MKTALPDRRGACRRCAAAAPPTHRGAERGAIAAAPARPQRGRPARRRSRRAKSHRTKRAPARGRRPAPRSRAARRWRPRRTRCALLAQMAGMPLVHLEQRAGPYPPRCSPPGIGTALAGKLGATDRVADLWAPSSRPSSSASASPSRTRCRSSTGSRWFPRRKGLVIGASLSGVGASAALFSSPSPARGRSNLGLMAPSSRANPPTDWPLNAPAAAPRSYLPALDTAWIDWLKRTGADKFFARPARAAGGAFETDGGERGLLVAVCAAVGDDRVLGGAATGLTASTRRSTPTSTRPPRLSKCSRRA